MFKSIGDSLSQVAAGVSPPERPAISEVDVKRVFMVMHGFYGNLFLSKFSTGVVENGEDQGIANARKIWAHGLRGYEAETIRSALASCQSQHPEFPPSMPQFVALCAAHKPRKAFRSSNQIGMSDALRSKYARQARAIIARHEERSERIKNGTRPPLPPGLDGLKQAIADAVGAAGGDEAAALVRLDHLFSAGAA